MAQGTDRAWAVLAGLAPEDVCQRAVASFDSSGGTYTLKCFGQDVVICPGRKELRGESAVAVQLLKKLGYFSELALLSYLAGAQDAPLSGQLVGPSDMKASQFFTRGSHVLPMNRVAGKYGSDPEAFLRRGAELSAVPVKLGDAAVQLLPFPRIPVTILLWRSDEEFPARADLLFDSSCEQHLPQDLLWSTAMISALIML